MSFVHRNFLSLTILLLCLLTAATAWYRFIHLGDYLVAFEVECDPAEQSCFIGCEDDDCTETYPYAEMERHAAELYSSCGPDILECEFTTGCPDNVHCEVFFCEADSEDGCYEEGNEETL